LLLITKEQNLGVLEFLKEKKKQFRKRNSKIYKEITPEQLFLEKNIEDIGDKFSKSNVVTVSVNFSGLVQNGKK
jgi:hypothetical protein